jgi:hypothetical protein
VKLWLPLLALLGVGGAQIDTMPHRTAARSLVVTPVPMAWKVSWDYSDTIPVEFEVWSSVDLKVWELDRVTTNREAVFLARPQQFFKVRARADDSYSDWATVKQ